ncbi:Elongator Complex Protein 3 [Manis pentadactyla]|nr:Elongator Complex Protein 3 [Manis pentadactyla]
MTEAISLANERSVQTKMGSESYGYSQCRGRERRTPPLCLSPMAGWLRGHEEKGSSRDLHPRKQSSFGKYYPGLPDTVLGRDGDKDTVPTSSTPLNMAGPVLVVRGTGNTKRWLACKRPSWLELEAHFVSPTSWEGGWSRPGDRR